MKYIFPFLVFTILTIGSIAQNNALVITDGAFIVLNDGIDTKPINLVINQPHQNGITTSGASGGNIISESEYNYVKWNIGNGAGTYTVPFITTNSFSTEQKIPLSLGTTTAGVGAGHILFSTYRTDNYNDPRPFGVTHLESASGNPDNSLYVIDRFWIIDAVDYTTKPAVQLSFGFSDDTYEIGGANLFPAIDLGAQRFNSDNDRWEGSHSGSAGIWGTAVLSPGNNRVKDVNIAPSEFYRAWTLADYSSPLPMQLSYFNAACENATINLTWENSNAQGATYLVEKSVDGIHFSPIGSTNTLNNETNFTFIDRNPYIDQSYYRIVIKNQTNDYHSKVITVRNCAENETIFVYSPLNDNHIFIEITAEQQNSKHQFLLVDLSGKIIQQQELNTTNKGSNQFRLDASGVASGIYSAVLINEQGVKKVTKLVL